MSVILDAYAGLAPAPVALISCRGREGAMAKDNLFTVAWTGVACSDPPMVYISVRKTRFSHQLIDDSGEFCINLVDKPMLEMVNWCGKNSGRDVDKFAHTGFTKVKAPELNFVSYVAESPLSLCCKLEDMIELGSHDMFLASVAAVVSRDDCAPGERPALSELVAYVGGKYVSVSPI